MDIQESVVEKVIFDATKQSLIRDFLTNGPPKRTFYVKLHIYL